VILIDGFSKRYAMTGWRLGYAAAPSDICKGMIKLLNNMTSCPSSFIQYGGIAALRGPQEAVQMMRKELEARRDQIYQAFKEVRSVSAVKPKGAFYLFVKVSEVLDRLGMTSEQFVQHLLDRFGVAVLHGSAMGKHGEGYIRISFGASSKTITEGVERIKSAIT
jgi:aspartate/methionine/tyrosine aminotransferase